MSFLALLLLCGILLVLVGIFGSRLLMLGSVTILFLLIGIVGVIRWRDSNKEVPPVQRAIVEEFVPFWALIPEGVAKWYPAILIASEKCKIPPAVAVAMMIHENASGDPTSISVSGAVGLTQVMPKEAGFPDRPTRTQLLDPVFNIEYGFCHLAGLLQANHNNLWESYYGYYGHDARGRQYAYEVLETYNNIKDANLLFAYPPLENWVVSGYYYKQPVTHQSTGWHTGYDIAGQKDAPLYAVWKGIVERVGDTPNCANPGTCYGDQTIWLRIGRDTVVVYAHAEKAFVERGDIVEPGEMIGIQGTRGYSNGQHVHFELRYKDKFTNPLPYIPKGE